MELVPVTCTVAAPQGLRRITVLPEMRGQMLAQRAFSSSIRWMKWTERQQQDNPDKRNQHNGYNYQPPTYCQMFYRFCVINICMPFCVVFAEKVTWSFNSVWSATLLPIAVPDTLVTNSNTSERLFEKRWGSKGGCSNSTDRLCSRWVSLWQGGSRDSCESQHFSALHLNLMDFSHHRSLQVRTGRLYLLAVSCLVTHIFSFTQCSGGLIGRPFIKGPSFGNPSVLNSVLFLGW